MMILTAALALTLLQDPLASLQWADHDLDGHRDLLALEPDGRAGPRLLRNLGDGGFEDVTDRVGLGGLEATSAALWRDLDGDRRPDLLAIEAGSLRVLLGGPGSFVDATATSGLEQLEGVRAARWIDFDGDGRIDLQLGLEAGAALFRGLGEARFEAVELELGRARGPGAGIVARADVEPAAEGTAGGAAASNAGPGPGVAPGPIAPRPDLGSAQPAQNCAPALSDALMAGCISASTVPTLGMLYPLSSDLFVNALGDVGIGTTQPGAKLEVVGDVLAAGQLISSANSGPPLEVSSNALVKDLNADRLDGLEASAFSQFGSQVDGSELAFGAVTDTHVSSFAAIQGNKIVPDFGSSDVTTTGRLGGGTSSPLASVHARDSGLGLSGAMLGATEDVVIESQQAWLGLASSAFGAIGSGISLKEVLSGTSFDTWSIHRGTSPTGSNLTFSHGDEDIPWNNPVRMTLQEDGDLGLGTTSPSVRLQVEGGSDVSLGGGGYLQLGGGSGLNLALDNNEIMARSNGGSTTLHLNVDGGNVTVSQNDPGGRLGVGTSAPSGRLHVVDAAGGDGSVVLPNDSIGSVELLAEAGAANAVLPSSKDFKGPGGWLEIDSVTIDAPTSGYVLLFVSLHNTVPPTSTNQYALSTSSTGPTFGQVYSAPTNYGASSIFNNLTFHAAEPVGAGSTTFYLIGSQTTSKTGTLVWSTVTALFVPTAYGTFQ